MTTKRITRTGRKTIIFCLLGVLLLFSVAMAAERQKPDNPKDKESYSLGYQFGQSLKQQGLEINLDVYTAGVRDALAGKEGLMTSEEIQSTVSGIQQRVTAARQKELKEASEKNLAASKAFLEENKKKEGVKTLPSGLEYKVLEEGKGRIPKKTDKVTIQYRAFLMNGEEFDSSYGRSEPHALKVDEVIPGWSEALQLMKEGSKWRLFVPPELGFGQRFVPPVQPNTVVIFDLELVAIN